MADRRRQPVGDWLPMWMAFERIKGRRTRSWLTMYATARIEAGDGNYRRDGEGEKAPIYIREREVDRLAETYGVSAFAVA